VIQLKLTPAQLAAYKAALVTSHAIRIIVTVRDRNEQPVSSLQLPKVLTGAIQVDSGAAVTRSLSMTCLDPNHKLTFDTANPADGALYADNFISVTYGVETSLGWVDVPVFWGPVTAYSRQGPEVTIEAQGKESLALDPFLITAGYNLPRSQQISASVTKVMSNLGEQRISLGMVTGRLVKRRTVIRGESAWMVCVGGGTDANGNPKPGLMSKAVGHPFLYYDGNGTLTAKTRGGPAVHTFDGDWLLSRPGFAYDVLQARNQVYVEGATPKKSKRHYAGVARLPATHPLSGQSLARNGKPRYLTEMAQSDTLKSDAACRRDAKTRLAQLANQGLEATFDCLPAPHLEENDTVQLAGVGYAFTFPLRTFAIPLTHDTPMSVGGGIQPRLVRK